MGNLKAIVFDEKAAEKIFASQDWERMMTLLFGDEKEKMKKIWKEREKKRKYRIEFYLGLITIFPKKKIKNVSRVQFYKKDEENEGIEAWKKKILEQPGVTSLGVRQDMIEIFMNQKLSPLEMWKKLKRYLERDLLLK